MKQKRIFCLFLTVATLLGILPTTTFAACSHRYERIYTIENERMHSYESECTRCGEINNSYGYAGWENHDRDSWGECIDCGHCDHSRAVTEYYYENDNKHSFETECENCGKVLTGGSYSGWEDHNFWRDECEDCGYTRECTHDDSETVYEYYTATKHETASYCYDCGITYNTIRESHDWEYTDWESISEYEHERTYYCPLCEFEDTETDGHDFYRGYCESCGEEESSSGGYEEEASVSLSATGPSGTLGSAGGEITAESLPASYTVTATATGCNVEKIVYVLDGKRQTAWDDSVTITVNSEDEFESTNFTVYTDADVSATFTVNFKYVRKNTSYYMWRTSHEATVRSITGNGLNKSLAHTMTIPNSYDTQTNLSDDQVAEIQGLIGRNDGKTYLVGYTRKITVYTPASMSYNGREIVHDTFDGNNASEIEDCVSRWSWNSSTVSAIRQAAKSTLTFTTTEVTDFIARWIDTTVHEQLYVKNLSGETISGSQNKYVSVSYSDFPDHWYYTYDYLEYTGASSGTSTSDNFSRYVTTSTEPLTITFYCHSEEEETEPETDWETEWETEPETDDYYEDEDSLSITVYVRDAETSALLSSAYVTDDDWYGGYTNRYGYVKFYDPESGGRYKFTASKSGYYSNTGSVRASASNPDAMLTIYLTPIETEEEEEILGDVIVYVRDNDTNAVISGASVGCGGTTKTTNSSGYTTFYDLATDRYTIVASKSGYQSGSGTVSVTSSGTKTITIYLTPIPPTTGNITVTVRNSQTNAVISGASVTAGGYSGTTNSGGTVTFSSLSLGDYRITASKSGYSTGTTNTTVSSTTPSQNITIYLTPIATTGTVTVTVRDADTNAVIPGAGVSNGRGYGTTTSSGTITFGTLSFGTYTFTASKTGYISGSSTATISSSSPNKSITIYLEKEPTYDVGITANAVTGTVYRGSTIMVAAKIKGDATLDCTPTTPLTISMQATRNGGSVFDTQTKTVICPKNKTNLVWFAVEIPTSGYSRADVSFRFEVELPSGYTDSQTSDNTSVQTVTTYILPDRSVPDASFELTPPATFTNSAYKTTSHPELTWQVWEWNGGFVEKTYRARLTSTARLTPDATAVWSKDDGRGNWTTRSGYGLNTDLSVSLTGVPADMFTGNAKVNAYYPEFGYTTDSAQSNMLYRASETPFGYSASYAFPEDEDSISGGRMHKTPIWFPDGDYSVKYEIYDLWTPAGMLTGSTYALVKIQGSMYDDYYTQRQ